ncbi:MAG: transposase, partial [Candidatus Hydrogenedentes bacterium]|nr:transposase [Candidatus Hydrogenedentota bacterium]
CQCRLLQVPRSSAYYTPNLSEPPVNLALMREIDERYLKRPFYGSPRMTTWLKSDGILYQQQTRCTFDARNGFAGNFT